MKTLALWLILTASAFGQDGIDSSYTLPQGGVTSHDAPLDKGVYSTRTLLQPPPKPTGPTTMTVPVGEFAELSAPNSSAAGYSWVVQPKPVQSSVVDDGRRFFVASGTKSATYVVVLAYIDGDKPTQLVWLITVVGDPGPSPGPNPKPPLPGLTGIALVAYQESTKLPPDARKQAAALAGVYRSVAARMAAGTLTMTEALSAATTEGNDALGIHRNAWLDWNDAVVEAMKELYGPSRPTIEAHAQVLRDIAQGLEAVK